MIADILVAMTIGGCMATCILFGMYVMIGSLED